MPLVTVGACYQGDGSTAEQVDYPASDPRVTAAGGTSLFGPADEVAWNWCRGDESPSWVPALTEVKP